MPDILIRPGNPEDIEACVAIDTEAFHIYTAGRRRTLLQRSLEKTAFLVAVAGDRIVGYATFDPDWFHSTFLKLVVIDKDWRRRGIAVAMIRQIARDHCPGGKFFSSTEEDNQPSLALHQKLGFRACGYLDGLPQPGRELFFLREVGVEEKIQPR